MVAQTHRSHTVVALSALLFSLAAAGCGSHGSAGSAGSPAPSISPAALATPYLGIERLDKAYVPALKRNVLVVTLAQMPRGADPNGLASAVYDGIKGSLSQSNFDLAVVKIPMTRSSSASSNAVIIYARDSRGHWARSSDPALIEAIDRAGL